MRMLFVVLSLSLSATSAAAQVESSPPDDGFESIFDGKSLKGWEGDQSMFRVQDGAIVAGNLRKPIPHNEFLCTKKSYSDFELRLKVKAIGEGVNAGIQFRTRRIPNHHEVSGYQADVGQDWWGKLYDESRRRKILAGKDAAQVNEGDWNDYVIRCEGPRVQLWLNGILTVDYTEPDDSIERDGIIAVQIHGGPPSEAWYRDLRIKELN